MNDVFLQILLILAYLAIGLIAVTFPVYAISVTYLRQEEWESKKAIKKRIEELKGQISRFTKELSGEQKDSEMFKQLQAKIKNYTSEKKNLELRAAYLSAIGAVVLPVIILLCTLISAGIGIYFFYEDSDIVPAFIITSVISSAAAIFSLFKTVLAIEYAALRPARSIEFDVGFDRECKETTKTVKQGEEFELVLYACTQEDEVENLFMLAQMSSELEFPEGLEYGILVSRYPEHTFVRFHQSFLPKGWPVGFGGPITPKKVGEYAIKIYISAKGIYENLKELTLNVVK